MLRVLKPGGHLLSFGGARTYHRLACAIEDAGFEIRDRILTLNGEEHWPVWIFGSGFPKNLDVSKAIDKAAGAEREVVGSKVGLPGYSLGANDTDAHTRGTYGKFTNADLECAITAPATDAAKQWQGWGSALKPAHEPVCVARKPLEGTVAANVLKWGTRAINVDGCRIPAGGDKLNGGRVSTKTDGWDRPWKHDEEAITACRARGEAAVAKAEALGRWPANVIHDGSPEVLAGFPETKTGSVKAGTRENGKAAGTLGAFSGRIMPEREADTGSAARFFYCAKASKADRDEGLEAFEKRSGGMISNTSGQHITRRDEGYQVAPRANNHPTVKPTNLMRYLVRLVTPPGGVVLDPFMGSGSIGKAAALEGFRFIGIEHEAEYVEIAQARIAAARSKAVFKPTSEKF
jgi:site-specific DNA-methyltransferase (adenine-specific)